MGVYGLLGFSFVVLRVIRVFVWLGGGLGGDAVFGLVLEGKAVGRWL